MSRLQELIDELCPDGVEYVRLGDTCFIKSRIGWQRLTKSEYLDSGDFYLITGVDIRPGFTIDYESCHFVTKERYEMDSNIQLKNGDVIVTKDGTIGKVAIVDNLTKPAVLNSHLFVIRINAGIELTPRFLAYVLTSHVFTSFVEKRQTGSTRKGLNQQVMVDLRIPVPPIEVQREVVRILDEYTAAHDELVRQLEEEMRLREQQLSIARNELLTHDCRLQWATLGELMTIERGASPRPIKKYVTDDAGGIPWIKIGDVDTGGKYITSTAERITKDGASKSRFLESGSFVLSNSMSYGRPYILKIDGCIHDGWLSLKEYEAHFDTDYLYHLLRSDVVQKYWDTKVNSSSVSNLNSDLVKGTPVPIPPIDEQKRISALLDAMSEPLVCIQEELMSEVELVKYQFTLIRNQLLSFPEIVA